MPDHPPPVNYPAAQFDCDIVMKGGITSGVVYPLAVCEIAREFNFRNIGGTSAGAIAAAATAAAEYGRTRKGFNKLEELPVKLEENLTSLFQPQRSTRPLFGLLLAAVGPGGKVVKPCLVAGAMVLWFWWAALIGIALSVAAVAGFVCLTGGDPADLSRGAVLACAIPVLFGAVVAIVARIWWIATRAIPDNNYGMCSGCGPEGADPKPLTTWLHELINGYAGKGADEVLTFGDLEDGPPGARNPEPGKPFVRLAMMTTNLTNGTAHRLPLTPDGWFFKEEEFRALFPRRVVDAMLPEHPEQVDAPEGFWPWPDQRRLPIVVAARMSLSFPVLLSAMPLWRVDEQRALREGKRTLERCWFSDGGISSNFPVHFFDGIVPRWPTFAINLRPFRFGDGDEAPESEEEKNVVMVHDQSEPITDWWYPLPDRGSKRLTEFLSRIAKTMQNRADEAQMRVPGYRDRVVHVQLTKKQGGMNLAMDEKVIERLTERGRIAGERLVHAYVPGPPRRDEVTWVGHRWTRLWSSFAVLETMMDTAARGYNWPRPGEPTYEELIESGDGAGTEWRMKHDQKQLTLKFGSEAERLGGETLADGAPPPPPEGRIVPRD